VRITKVKKELSYEQQALIHEIFFCVARSPDGVTRWQRNKHNPILSPTKDAWDGDACYKPTVMWEPENNRWLLWYNGRHAAPEYIGMAIHEGYDLGFES